ncbi:hemolysin family protein [Clostridium estertheticum]|uniref:Hemolysin family protein n=1 Tax=Clostridium estertheticum TaxID=238834 RepID=A0AA47EIK2_9CLOT|nr:hemolysin family protein [Clostridium estertheticum]MBU3155537.1 hemolysin family protein [Clostridium estertheticum]MBU3198061.1 hemolysin family protein [Clostridium estertheticum]WAG60064.1 hemolysin family protein [Clostridium estertheticum]WAG65856.1 hemolysin family protein [Clostridium estertheticum]
MESEPAPMPNSNIVVQLILIVILTLINAFFASAEMAIVSLNKNKIKHLAEEGNKKAILLSRLIEKPTKFLSTVQVGITFAGFFLSAYVATAITGKLSLILSNISVPYSEGVALVVITIGLAYITLVFGELFPKRIALQNSQAIAMFSVVPIMYISKIVTPFVSLLTVSTNILVKITGLGHESKEEKLSKEEIKSLIEVGQEHGVINETEKEMINNIIEFDDKLAREVMTPRTDIYMIDINDPITEYLDELLIERHSRVPVFEGDVDNIVGILHMKDFMIEARKNGFENVNIKNILHSPYFVQENKNIDELFKELKSSKNHIAMLIDEYGGFSGVVTTEDITEEIMGNIEDEYDHEEPEIKKVDNNTYIVSGLLSLDDLNEHLDLNLVSKDYNTIGGFLINLMGCIPKINEERTVEYGDVIFRIEEVRERRIEKIKICI